MTSAINNDEASKVAYVVDLATKLADRILNARFGGREIVPEQVTALVRAAQLLQDLSVPWPPLMEQALYEFADGVNSPPKQTTAEEESVGAKVGAGISRFLGTLRHGKVSPT